MFRMLGILVFVIALIKIAFPLIVAIIAIFAFIFLDARSENKQEQGKEYRTIKIGTQIWMSENLGYNATSSKCYNNNPKNCAKCGRLYDWQTAKKACPNGWHLPTRSEWDALVNYVGGSNIAGNKLKARNGWQNGGNGTDNYGFSGLACGYGTANGNFHNSGNYSYWWSSSENNFNNAYFQSIDDKSNVYRNHLDKILLFSVRCVKN